MDLRYLTLTTDLDRKIDLHVMTELKLNVLRIESKVCLRLKIDLKLRAELIKFKFCFRLKTNMLKVELVDLKVDLR